MSMIALVCPKCGGPLAASAATALQTECPFCSVVLCRVAHDFEAASDSTPSAQSDQIRSGRAAFDQLIQKGFGDGRDPREVLKSALHEHLGLQSEADVIVAVAFGLVEEFAREHDVDESRNPIAICRLASAYMKAADALRESDSASLDLPYFSANSDGPIHYSRTLTVADIQMLATGATLTGAIDEPKKKWWWPF